MSGKYITQLYGHPGQIMPSHIVITSPYFDTREVVGQGYGREGTREFDRKKRREDIYAMRQDGSGFFEIGQALGISTQAAKKVYNRYMATRGALYIPPKEMV